MNNVFYYINISINMEAPEQKTEPLINNMRNVVSSSCNDMGWERWTPAATAPIHVHLHRETYLNLV